MDTDDIPFVELDLDPDLDLPDCISIDEGLAIIEANRSTTPLSPPPTASTTLYSNKISIRIPTHVLNALKARADASGIGYQTLINQILAEHIAKPDSDGANRLL